MRIVVGAALAILLTALPAAAQNDNAASQPGVTGKPTAHHQFRKSAARPAVLRARTAARRAAIAA